jgi:threonine synthase
MNASSSDFARRIDTRHEPTESVVLRYRRVVQPEITDDRSALSDEWLQKTSIREGARIVHLLSYRGADLYVLDETSLMHTRSMKSIDGCVTTAKCKALEYERVVFESGGNTGTALTVYGQRAGLETFLFLPEDNLCLLNGAHFAAPTAHLLAVEDPDLVKQAAQLFREDQHLHHIPRTEWRYEASRYRGCFLLEYLLGGHSFDWMTQTISAAFGPIGVYSVLTEFADSLARVPRFLGVQQEANCPMARAWRDGRATPVQTEAGSAEPLLANVMYDRKPYSYGTYDDLRETLGWTGGDIVTVNHAQFAEFLERDFDGESILARLADVGIEITIQGGQVLEKAGMLCLAGTLDQIDRGHIESGCKILCCLTGGMSEGNGQAKPDYRIADLESLEAWLREPSTPTA